MLSNEMYIGRMVWNKRRFTKHPITGKYTSRPNPKSEWTVKEIPKLRIIEDDLWDRVQARRAEMMETHQARQKDRWYNKKTKQWHGGENTRHGRQFGHERPLSGPRSRDYANTKSAMVLVSPRVIA